MTKRWITNNRDRATKRFAALHAQLGAELKDKKIGIRFDKETRKYVRSEMYRHFAETVESAF